MDMNLFIIVKFSKLVETSVALKPILSVETGPSPIPSYYNGLIDTDCFKNDISECNHFKSIVRRRIVIVTAFLRVQEEMKSLCYFWFLSPRHVT